MRLLLVIPTAGQPVPAFLDALSRLAMPSEVTAFERLTVSGNFVPAQREFAVRRALERAADTIVMIDDDMIVPPDALAALCNVLRGDPGIAIAGALYYSRDGLRPMAAGRWNSRDTTTASIPGFAHAPVDVDAVGFGCVALRADALRALKAPYFSTQVYIENAAARVRVCNEDYLLCERLRGEGWRIALHGGVRCGHADRTSGVTQPIAWEDDAETARERMLVVEPGPKYRLVAYDAAGRRAPERHESATIDYLFVD